MTKEKVLERLEILGKQKHQFFKTMLSTNWAFCTDNQFAIILYSNALEENADTIEKVRKTMPVTQAVKDYLYNLLINLLTGDITFTASGYISIIEEIFLACIRLSNEQLLEIAKAARALDQKLAADPTLVDFWEDNNTSFEKEFSRLFEIPEITVSRDFDFIPEENEILYKEMRKKVEIYFEASSNILVEPFSCYKPASTSLEGFTVNLFKYDFGTPIFRKIVEKHQLSFDKIFFEIFEDADCCTASFTPFDLFEKEFTSFLGRHPEVMCNLYSNIIFAEDFSALEEAFEKIERKYNYSIDDFYKKEVSCGAYHNIKVSTLVTMIYFAPMHAFETVMQHTATIANYALKDYVSRMNAMGNIDFKLSITFINGDTSLAEKSIRFADRQNTATQFDLAVIRHYADMIGL